MQSLEERRRREREQAIERQNNPMGALQSDPAFIEAQIEQTKKQSR
jgi:hypothetical protein